MKTPTRVKTQTIEARIHFIERTIRRLGACSINNGKLTSTELAALRERFSVEQAMGYTKFRTL